MATYKIQFFDFSGVLQETTTEALSAKQAVDDVLAREENSFRVVYRVVRCYH